MTTCKWVDESDSGYWHSDCGYSCLFDVYGPEENGMKFCAFCGKPLEVVPYEYEPETKEDRIDAEADRLYHELREDGER